MSARGHAAMAALVLLAFSTQTPAPQVPDSPNEHQVPEAARVDARLKQLVEIQTDAINTLNQKLIAIEQRVAKLEKEKNHG
jgi:small-conductance mechanosensitive channel